MNKKIVLILSFLILILLIGNVLAITASIGNARMVLRAEKGEKIEKYILVKNVNNVTVDIKLTASGDLEKDVDIKDEEFTLAPGEEKKAYFTIKVKEEGTTETKINVQFTPVDGKNGVGLSSTIIVITKEEGSDEDSEDDDEDLIDDETGVLTGTTGRVVGAEGNKKYVIALSITGVVFMVFLVLLIVYYTKFKKKAEKNKAEKEKKTKLKKRVKRHA